MNEISKSLQIFKTKRIKRDKTKQHQFYDSIHLISEEYETLLKTGNADILSINTNLNLLQTNIMTQNSFHNSQHQYHCVVIYQLGNMILDSWFVRTCDKAAEVQQVQSEFIDWDLTELKDFKSVRNKMLHSESKRQLILVTRLFKDFLMLNPDINFNMIDLSIKLIIERIFHLSLLLEVRETCLVTLQEILIIQKNLQLDIEIVIKFYHQLANENLIDQCGIISSQIFEHNFRQSPCLTDQNSINVEFCFTSDSYLIQNKRESERQMQRNIYILLSSIPDLIVSLISCMKTYQLTIQYLYTNYWKSEKKLSIFTFLRQISENYGEQDNHFDGYRSVIENQLSLMTGGVSANTNKDIKLDSAAHSVELMFLLSTILTQCYETTMVHQQIDNGLIQSLDFYIDYIPQKQINLQNLMQTPECALTIQFLRLVSNMIELSDCDMRINNFLGKGEIECLVSTLDEIENKWGQSSCKTYFEQVLDIQDLRNNKYDKIFKRINYDITPYGIIQKLIKILTLKNHKSSIIGEFSDCLMPNGDFDNELFSIAEEVIEIPIGNNGQDDVDLNSIFSIINNNNPDNMDQNIADNVNHFNTTNNNNVTVRQTYGQYMQNTIMAFAKCNCIKISIYLVKSGLLDHIVDCLKEQYEIKQINKKDTHQMNLHLSLELLSEILSTHYIIYQQFDQLQAQELTQIKLLLSEEIEFSQQIQIKLLVREIGYLKGLYKHSIKNFGLWNIFIDNKEKLLKFYMENIFTQISHLNVSQLFFIVIFLIYTEKENKFNQNMKLIQDLWENETKYIEKFVKQMPKFKNYYCQNQNENGNLLFNIKVSRQELINITEKIIIQQNFNK